MEKELEEMTLAELLILYIKKYNPSPEDVNRVLKLHHLETSKK